MGANDIGPRIGIQGEQEFRTSLNAINAQMKSLAAEMRAVTAEFAENAQSEEAMTARNEVLGRSVEAAKNKLTVLDGQLDRQRGKLSELAQELERAAAEYGENSTQAAQAQNAYNRQVRTVADLETQYQRTREQLAQLEQQMRDAGDAADDANDQLGGADLMAAQAGWDLIKTGVQGVTQALRESIQVGMEFDQSISDIAATMGTTVDHLGDLRGFAQEMGATTAFTATQAGQALNYMALAGYDAEKSMSMLPNVLNLAAAGGMELATASDMVTDAQTALGLSIEETERLVDEMAKTSTRTNTSVAQLGEAILTVGGTAKFMAGGTQELNQVLGALADNSIKGAEGSTKLRNIILSLSSPTDKAAAQLDRLGVSVFDAEGNMRRFSEIFPETQRALSSLTDQDQITALGEIFNNRDIAAAQALLGTTVERWDELAVAIDGAQGSAQRMAETRLDNLAGDLTLFQSAADGARIALSDSLTPALRDVTQVGTSLMSVLGGAINEAPILGQAVTGLVAGLGVLGVGMAAATAATTSLGAALSATWAAVIASPLAPFAVAVGVGVTALTAFAHAAEHAEDKITSAGQAVQESREAWESQRDAVNTQRQDVEALAAQLEDLAGRENRTAGEKERLLAVTEALNQAVPGLGLSYDAVNDTLNMTTQQVLELARAQAELEERQAAAASVVQAEQVHAQAVRELEQATKDLAAAQSALADAQNAGMDADLGSIETMQGLKDAVNLSQRQVKELEQAVVDSEAQVAEMSQELEDFVAASEEAAGAVEDAAVRAETASVSLQELEEATLYAAGAAETMSDALKEQEKDGSLSLETTKELIDAGYEAAISLDEETGAVTLNRAEYIKLANAKIQEQIATLEAEKASLRAKAAMEVEANSAYNAGSAYWEAAKAKAAAAKADDIQALNLQIAALTRAQKSMESYGTAASSTAKKSSSASKKIKTQAEQDLADYKELKATLDHEQAMGLVQDEEYYRRLGELRDQYLTGEENLSEYRKASETIYKAGAKAAEEALKEEEKALQERQKAWQEASDGILKLEEEFQQKLADRAGQIAGSYKLFEEVPERQRVSGAELLKNLEEQNKSIETFYTNLDRLADRQVNAALVDEIRAMGVGAQDQLQALLSMTDDQLSRYSELYGEKQELANSIAQKELEGLRELTNEQILGQLDDVAELYDTNGPTLGLAFANSLADGMFEGMPEVEAMGQTLANAALAAFERAYSSGMESMMVQSGGSRLTKGDVGELLAGAVNGINAGGGSYGGGDLTIQIPIDGRVLAETTLEDFRTVGRERPETLDDT